MTKFCPVCERELPATNKFFRGRPRGLESICKRCAGNGRTLAKPYLLKPAKEGQPSKHCRPCDRDLPLTGFSKNNATKDKLYSICQDCQFLANKTGSPYRVRQDGPALRRAYYEERIINGRKVIVREVR